MIELLLEELGYLAAPMPHALVERVVDVPRRRWKILQELLLLVGVELDPLLFEIATSASFMSWELFGCGTSGISSLTAPAGFRKLPPRKFEYWY